MKVKATLRGLKTYSANYWCCTTDPTESTLRQRFFARANKPSGKRKALAVLAAKHPRVNPLIKYQDPALLGIKA